MLPCPPSSIVQESMDPFYLPLAPFGSCGASSFPQVLVPLPKRKSLEIRRLPTRMTIPRPVPIPAPPSPARTTCFSPATPRASSRNLPSPSHPDGAIYASEANPIPSSEQDLRALGLQHDLCQRRHRPATTASGSGTANPSRNARLLSEPGCGMSLRQLRAAGSSPTASKDISKPPRSPPSTDKAASLSPRPMRSPQKQPPRTSSKVGPRPLPLPPSWTPPIICETPTRGLKHVQAQAEEQRIADNELEAQQQKQHHKRQGQRQERQQEERLYEDGQPRAGMQLTPERCRLVHTVGGTESVCGQQLNFSTPRDAISEASKDNCRTDLPPKWGASGTSPTSLLMRAAEFEVMCRSGGGGFCPVTPPLSSRNKRSVASSYASSSPVVLTPSSTLPSEYGNRNRRTNNNSVRSDISSIKNSRSFARRGSGDSTSKSSDFSLWNCALKEVSHNTSNGSSNKMLSAGWGSSGAPVVYTSTRLFSSTGGGSSNLANDRPRRSSKTAGAGISFLAFARATQMGAAAASVPISPVVNGMGAKGPLSKAASPPIGKRLGKPNMPRITGL
ncbi:hypothetical protein Vretimale_3588 [Volvox reticuliferus]|nr:hypothetical protein Vretimale_3588 [Volvox reticuliferus]